MIAATRYNASVVTLSRRKVQCQIRKKLPFGRGAATAFLHANLAFLLFVFLILGSISRCRAEAMLQLFNVNWEELTRKMPEIAEAGYTSLWLPPPSKAGSVFSVGYDLFDPFDLGDKNQRGTVRTRYGTKEELLRLVETAHRFGLRVYFDNIVNHRGFDVPGYNASTPLDVYPGLRPQDFHLQVISGGYYRNWPNVSDWNDTWQVQHQPLFGLIDLATEPGGQNNNCGSYLGATIAKPVFIRHPANPGYYMDTALPAIAPNLHPFNGSNGKPVSEEVNTYLVRAAMWMLNETRCDGFRLDAVKHVPSGFFGDTSDTANGYTGGIQAMYDYVHGYGNNLLGNGYTETGGNRDSVFDTERSRNDAMIFGEHLGQPPGFQEYLDRGMRLLNTPYHFQLNNILGNPSASLSGLDQRDYRPYAGAFTGPQSVLFAQSHDDAFATARDLQNAYNFTREGLPLVYSDGYNLAQANPGEHPFPRHAYAPYLGQFGDNKMPDLAWLHHQLSRGGTRPRWSDNDIVAYERYDYREVVNAYYNPDATVLFFAMNDNYASDISFDDGVAQTTSGTFYECFPVSNSRAVGLVCGFPPGSVLHQLADAPNKTGACTRLLVREATSSLAEAQATANDPDPARRKVYVGGQALAPGGGALELKIPRGSYVLYGYQWPEPSRVGFSDAITLRQGGALAPRLTVWRTDGVDGDSGFNPIYPFKMRGSVASDGSLVGGASFSNRTYTIDVPVITNAPLDILVRCDASAANVLVKLGGGMDINSQMGLGSTSGLDRRDNKPGTATDVFLGYEQAAQQFRYGPEKFAAKSISRNNVTSAGAETYHYTVGGSTVVVNGSGNGANITLSTAAWIFHDPEATNSAAGAGSPAQRVPLNPAPGQSVDLFVKVGYKLQINRCFVYYTTDGSNPEGSFGSGQGSTQVVEAAWVGPDSADSNVDWWKATIPGTAHAIGTQVRYKIALFKDDIAPISGAEFAKVYGLNQAVITGFDPGDTLAWIHNNLNTNHARTGLLEGFHILRARTFLPRSGKSSVFNTFVQTFYYDASSPEGAIAFPASDGASISTSSYTIVVRADTTVTGVEFNIADSDPFNDDGVTGQNNGNGLTNGVPQFVSASEVSPDNGISQQYPGHPREFRFDYVSIPSSGTGLVTVHLKESTSDIIPGRVTSLTRHVNTAAPEKVLNIANPALDGAIVTLSTNQLFTIHACFTPTLTTNDTSLFSIYINGMLQPRGSYLLRPPGTVAGCPNLRSLLYNWTTHHPGTNVIEVLFTNLFTLSASRSIAVARPQDSDLDGMSDPEELMAGTDPYDPNSVLKITGLSNGNLVVWDSVPNVKYQVLATTNVVVPMAPVSPVLTATGGSTFFLDASGIEARKFYRIQVIP